MIGILLAAAVAAGFDPASADAASAARGSIFRETVEVSVSAPRGVDADWVSAIGDEVRRGLAASGVVKVAPEGAARYRVVVEAGRAEAVRVPCGAADGTPGRACPPGATYARATLAARVAVQRARLAPDHTDVVVSGEWSGDSSELAAGAGDSPDPMSALEAVRAAARELAARIARGLEGVPAVQPKIVVGAFDGDGFALGDVPEEWQLGQTLQIFHPTDAGLGAAVGYARLRRTSSGDGYAEVVELHSGADPLVLVPRAATGLHVSAHGMIEMLPWQFPYDHSGVTHMQGPTVQIDWGFGALRDHDVDVSLALDWLQMGGVSQTTFTAAHAMLGLVKKWQHGPKYVFVALRAGAAYYLGAPATANALWALGGEAMGGNEFWLTPWASFVVTGGVRWLGAAFPTVVAKSAHDFFAEPKTSRQERAFLLLMGFKVTP